MTSGRTGVIFVMTAGICVTIGDNSDKINYPEPAPSSCNKTVRICGTIGKSCEGIGRTFDLTDTSVGSTGAIFERIVVIYTRTDTRGEWIVTTAEGSGRESVVALIRAWDGSLEPVRMGLRSRSSSHQAGTFPVIERDRGAGQHWCLAPHARAGSTFP